MWTQTFTYDALNRVDTAREVNGVVTWTQNFDYDQYGNRCLRSTPSLPCTPAVNAANNRLTGMSYDLAGNQLNDLNHDYSFDAENRIKTVDTAASYVYDGEGNRVRKLLGENIRMVYGIGGELLSEYDGTSGALKKEYIYGASGLVASVEVGVGTRYITNDPLGSPRIVTSTNGTVISRHDYQPFGEELFTAGGRTTAQGYSVVDNLRKQFTSKERDAETGLDYFLARYYSSPQGRFTSPDPLLSSGSIYDPQTWNRYSYALNNPLKFTDPHGLYVFASDAGEEQRRRFREGLTRLTAARDSFRQGTDGYNRLDRAIRAYGAEGTDNGVTVRFGTPTNGGAGRTDVGISDRNSDGMKDVTATNTTGQNTVVTIDLAQNRNTNDLATSIGHEGSHVADGAALVGALPNNLTSDAAQAILNGPLNLTKYQTESAAYIVSATVSQGLHNARYNVNALSIRSGGNDIEIWREGWHQADQAAIDRVLAVPRNQGGLYGVGPAPNQQGQRLIPQ